jgi:hypothetical protein
LTIAAVALSCIAYGLQATATASTTPLDIPLISPLWKSENTLGLDYRGGLIIDPLIKTLYWLYDKNNSKISLTLI